MNDDTGAATADELGDPIGELRDRAEQIRSEMGGVDRITRIHERGERTVREHIDAFLDDGSFVEIGTFRPIDAPRGPRRHAGRRQDRRRGHRKRSSRHGGRRRHHGAPGQHGRGRQPPRRPALRPGGREGHAVRVPGPDRWRPHPRCDGRGGLCRAADVHRVRRPKSHSAARDCDRRAELRWLLVHLGDVGLHSAGSGHVLGRHLATSGGDGHWRAGRRRGAGRRRCPSSPDRPDRPRRGHTRRGLRGDPTVLVLPATQHLDSSRTRPNPLVRSSETTSSNSSCRCAVPAATTCARS